MNYETFLLLGIIGGMILGSVIIIAWDTITALRQDRLRIFIIDASRTIKRSTVKYADNIFTIGERTYTVDPDRIYKTGLFRIPTAFYVQDDIEPKDFLDPKARSKFSAKEFNERTTNHIVKDIIAAFQEPFLSPTMSFILVAVAVVGGIGFLWWDLGGKLKEIIELLNAINAR